MPVKFRPSQTTFVKGKGKVTQHNFIKQQSQKELFDYINNASGKPKIKQKCVNELIRRGIKIQWTSEESNNELDLSRLR